MEEFNPVAGAQLGFELAQSVKNRFTEDSCTHLVTIPPRPSVTAPWPDWMLPELRDHLIDQGIKAPYSHQVATAALAWQGQHVVVATGTSSGKSLGYLMPILSSLAQNPQATALYLTPTKALGSDQLGNVLALTGAITPLSDVYPCAYDGDTLKEARAGIREQSRCVFSNPDMLHAAILPHHSRWTRFLRHLQYVVVDECHTYRGVFGAGVSLVLRRLLRLARRYGANPTVIFASATAAAPAEHAELLIGEPVQAITDDGAPSGARTVMLWEPGFIEGATGEHGAPVRRAASTEAAGMMATLIAEGARTLTFVRSRRGAEVVAMRTAEELVGMGRLEDARRVAAYRAGYLAEDRRRLERQLDSGELLGVASTNALELGIDVGGLDAVVTAGFPGTIASFWQQAGRAGRRGQGSLVALVARDEPMDTYLVHHPDALLSKPVERTVFNPHNPHILAGHLLCAAEEMPLSESEVDALGARNVVEALEAQGLMRHRPRGWFAIAQPGAPSVHSQVHLRGSGQRISIVDHSDGRLLGTIDAATGLAQVHPGAVYLHQGESFVVDELLLEDHVALVHPEAPAYSTHARTTTDIRIVGVDDSVQNPAPGLWLSNLEVEVTDRVVGYTVKASDGSIIDTVPLELPPQQLRTRAVAYTVDPVLLQELGLDDIPGTLHAAEHAAIGMLPLIATCDRWDIGGVSTAEHPDTGLPTVFVYDGHPGGAGFADCGFQCFAQWIAATFEAVRSCECESGCPSCVQSPKCGNGNQPLNKAGAIQLLGAMCTMLGVTP